MAAECLGDYRRFKTRPLIQSLVLLIVLTVPVIAQVPAPESIVKGPAVPTSKSPSPAEIERAISLAASYLERACGPDGRFAYRVDVKSGEQRRSYNIVRHAGAIYALSLLQHSQPDQQAVDAMARAALYMRRNYIGPGPRSNQLVVWSKPLPQSSAADLGATGLGLVALTSQERLKPNSVPLLQLQALGHFLVFLQKPDGSFISKYQPERGPDEEFESLYYPGEAALGLLDLYDIDHSPVWLNAATNALSFLARSRAGLAEVPPDHWALIATAKLFSGSPSSLSPEVREQLIHHAIQVCHALMSGQLRGPASPAVDGAFDPTGRTTPVATRLEGLLAALEFLPSGSLTMEIKEVISRGIAFLLRSQIISGPYAGGLQEAALPQNVEGADIRIDYVQHALGAWLGFQQMLGLEQ